MLREGAFMVTSFLCGKIKADIFWGLELKLVIGPTVIGYGLDRTVILALSRMWVK